MDKNKIKKIYVVGFPKSGNTWLTRLLADLLECKAGSGMYGSDEEEIASDKNDKKDKKEYKILKTHFLPEFQKEIDDEIKMVVYIKRNFKDVLISTFFYKYKSPEDEVKIHKLSQLIKKGPLKTIKYIRNRFRLWALIKKISEIWGKRVGEWKEHYNRWVMFSKSNPNTPISFINYEDLLNDTEKIVRRIFKKLKLPVPSDKKIKESIYKQSFKVKKKYFEKLPEDNKIPFGKDFNVKFMRKGTIGDWKNYLNKRIDKKINKYLNENDKNHN